MNLLQSVATPENFIFEDFEVFRQRNSSQRFATRERAFSKCNNTVGNVDFLQEYAIPKCIRMNVFQTFGQVDGFNGRIAERALSQGFHAFGKRKAIQQHTAAETANVLCVCGDIDFFQGGAFFKGTVTDLLQRIRQHDFLKGGTTAKRILTQIGQLHRQPYFGQTFIVFKSIIGNIQRIIFAMHEDYGLQHRAITQPILSDATHAGGNGDRNNIRIEKRNIVDFCDSPTIGSSLGDHHVQIRAGTNSRHSRFSVAQIIKFQALAGDFINRSLAGIFVILPLFFAQVLLDVEADQLHAVIVPAAFLAIRGRQQGIELQRVDTLGKGDRQVVIIRGLVVRRMHILAIGFQIFHGIFIFLFLINTFGVGAVDLIYITAVYAIGKTFFPARILTGGQENQFIGSVLRHRKGITQKITDVGRCGIGWDTFLIPIVSEFPISLIPAISKIIFK